MPGFDRTGPRGMGPRTGGGFGYCGGYGAHRPARFGLGRGGRPFGGGGGFGYGGGRGYGMHRNWRDYRDEEDYARDSREDLEMYARELESELKAIKKQLAREKKDNDSPEPEKS